MIKDANEKARLVNDWAVVRRLCANPPSYVIGMPPVIVTEARDDRYYNLPLVLAYGVIDSVLEELWKQGKFSAKKKRPGLKDLMLGSEKVLPWKDYKFVDAGRCDRNKVAHDGKLLSKTDCFKYIDAIEVELKVWGVL